MVRLQQLNLRPSSSGPALLRDLISAFMLACVHDLNMTNDSCFMTTADSRVTARGR